MSCFALDYIDGENGAQLQNTRNIKDIHGESDARPPGKLNASYSQREFLKSKKTATEILNVGVLIKSVFPDCECF